MTSLPIASLPGSHRFLTKLGGPQDIVNPCIRALNAFLRRSQRWFQEFRRLHRGTAQNIAAAIRAACDALHQASGVLADNQRKLQEDIQEAFSLVQVLVFELTSPLVNLAFVQQQQELNLATARLILISCSYTACLRQWLTSSGRSHAGAVAQGRARHPAHHARGRHPRSDAAGVNFRAARRFSKAQVSSWCHTCQFTLRQPF